MSKTNLDIIHIERFWDKIQIGDIKKCWFWNGAIQSSGYGSFCIGDGKTALAHRVAYKITYGKIPKGLCVCHSCDNRICCNPNHLFLDTIAGNIHDMVEKGRHAKGEKHGRAILNDFMVITMRSDYNDGRFTIEELAEKFHVNKVTAEDAIEGNTWKHLPLAE